MRRGLIAASLAAAVAATAAWAEIAAEEIPADALQLYAPIAIQLIQGQFPNPPVRVDADAGKVVGYHVQEKVGVIVLPDRNLTAKAIEDAGDREVPVALVATKSLSLQDRDTVVNGDKLAVADLNGMVKLPIFYLSARGKGEERTLEVYSREGKALASLPLKKQSGNMERTVSLKLSNINLEKKQLDATFSLGGTYEGTVKMAMVDL